MPQAVTGRAIRNASTTYNGLFTQGFASTEPDYLDYVYIGESTGSKSEYHFGGGVPQMREWLGERHAHQLARYTQELPNKTWELTVEVNREHFEDDNLSIYDRQFGELGASASLHPDTLMVELLENGFDEGVGYDGVAFFSDAHPTLNPDVTYSNLIDAPLSDTAFEAAITLFRQMVNDHGQNMRLLKREHRLVLTVAPNLESEARKILLAQRNEDGSTNTNYGRADLRVCDLLPDDHWFLSLTGSFFSPLIFQMRREPQIVDLDGVADETVFWKNKVTFGIDGRWAMGYGEPRHMVGSKGGS